MSVANKSVEQREDLFTAYCFKIFSIGILNADIMLHIDLQILNRRLSYQGLSKITKKTYLNIQQHVTISESSGPSIQSILSDPALDIFSTENQHLPLQKFLLDVALYLKKLRPNLWCNKVYKILILIDITTKPELKRKLSILNIEFQQYSVPPLHRTTIAVFSQALSGGLGTTDFIEEFKSDFGGGGW